MGALPINWALIKNPLNWIILTLMVLLAAFALEIVGRPLILNGKEN